MIEYVSGDLFDTKDRIIAHGCNAQGKFGYGGALVAGQIAKRYPWAYDAYKKYCDEWVVNNFSTPQLGTIIPACQDGFHIVNCITQNNYGRNKACRYVSYDAVDKAMWSLRQYMVTQALEAVSMPMIGAGSGNGNWMVLEAIIKDQLEDFRVTIYQLPVVH